jgi:hypothetical protein
LQLKNIINQLWASRDGAAKQFESAEGWKLGWEAIIGMWEREKAKRDSNQILYLLESYVQRDAWTKLNVKPAKIMQVSANMHELQSNVTNGILVTFCSVIISNSYLKCIPIKTQT